MRRGTYTLAAAAAVVTLGVVTPDAAAQDRGPDRDRGDRTRIIFGSPVGGARGERSRTSGESEDRPRVVCRIVNGAQVCTIQRDRRDRRGSERDREWELGERPRRGADARRGAGPPFCRSGDGHPVHGRRWCEEKGFGRYGRLSDGRGWEDIILRAPRDRRVDATLDRGDLIDILGDIVLGRFDRYARADGLRGTLSGRWLGSDELRLRAGSRPIADLRDVDRDGYVDVVALPRRD